MSRRIMYLRSENGHPVGCLAIQLSDGNRTQISYQVSVLNPRDKFNRAVARQLAIGRLVESPIKVNIYTGSSHTAASMHDISEAVMTDIASSSKFPTRAVKSAKLWLRHNGISTSKS